MSEDLLSSSMIKLYGRAVDDIVLQAHKKPDDLPPAPPRNSGREPPYRYGDNHFLRRQIGQADARLARIYGYAYEGEYYRLGAPAIFLVHGDGQDPGTAEPAGEGVKFADGMRMWEYDRADFSMRLELVSGPLEDILLEAEVQDRMASHAGRVQASGAGRVQVSGAGRVQVSHAGRMQVSHTGGKLD